MGKSIETKVEGSVEKITRTNGKKDASVSITMPASHAATIPLGRVVISIVTEQTDLFEGPRGKASEPVRAQKGKKVQGDKG